MKRGWLWKIVTRALIVVLAMGVVAVLVEAGYRIYLYRSLVTTGSNSDLLLVHVPLFEFDVDIGYRHRADVNTTFTRLDADNVVLQQHELQTNNVGWVSRHDYTQDKALDEYRIVVIGDSFTANLQNAITWSDELQVLLDADADLKVRLGADKITVFTFGQDGAGFEHFRAVAEHEVQRYAPDLVIVNFIPDDINRSMTWRESLPHRGSSDSGVTVVCSEPQVDVSNYESCVEVNLLSVDEAVLADDDQLDAIRRRAYRQRINNLPWWSLHSEVYARYRGEPRLNVTVWRSIGRKASGGAAFGEAVTAMQYINEQFPTFLALIHPTYDILTDDGASNAAASLPLMLGAIPIRDMQVYLPEADTETVEGWFHLPYDDHMNEVGQRVYAQAVYEMLVMDYWDIR